MNPSAPNVPSNSPAILLTGAAGFIGFHLAKRLLDAGKSVLGFDNLNDYYDPQLKEARLEILSEYPAFHFIHGDLTDIDTLKTLFAASRPPIVIHLAAQAGVRYSLENPRAYIDSNVIGFFNILEACRSYPVHHLVYASSSSVYGNQSSTPFSVSASTDTPVSLYAATKKSNELFAYAYSRLFGIPTTGLLFFTVYGPWGRPDMAYFKFTQKILHGEPIQVFNHGDMLRDFTYIDDIVSGIASLLDAPPSANEDGARFKVYNIGNNTPVKLSYFIETLERILGKTAVKEYLPMQPGDVYQTFADIDDLARDFQFSPSTPIEIGLAHFADWYRKYYGV